MRRWRRIRTAPIPSQRSFEHLILIRVLTMALTITVLRLLSHRMPGEDYSEYVILYQLMTWVFAFGFLGSSTALPKAIGRHEGNLPPVTLLVTAAVLVGGALILPLILVAYSARGIAHQVFGSPSAYRSIQGAVLYIVTATPYQLLSLYLIGTRRYAVALVAELMQSGAAPLALALLLDSPIGAAKLFFAYSCVNLLLSAALVVLAISQHRRQTHLGPVWPRRDLMLELLDTGVPKLLSGLFLVSLLAAFPLVIRLAGGSVIATAGASMGMSMAASTARLAATSNGLAGFMQLVGASKDAKGTAAIVERTLRVALGLGVALSVFALLTTDVVVRLVIGPIFDHQRILLDLGALVGAATFSVTILEVPLDAMKPPWAKAQLSIAFACLFGLMVGSLAWLNWLRPIVAVAAFWILLIGFAASLWVEVKRTVPTRGIGTLWHFLVAMILIGGLLGGARLVFSSVLWVILASGAGGLASCLLAFRYGLIDGLFAHPVDREETV